MRKTLLAAAVALLTAAPAMAAEAPKPPAQDWSFGGLFGTLDRAAAQRGYQVYKEVCAACHGMYHLNYRNLGEIGFNEDEVKAIAAQATVRDGPNDQGELFDRPGRPSDRFARPFPNEKAARAANNGAYPPDLSLIVKARADGANYLYGVLTGYGEPPAGVHMGEGMNWNRYFPGHQIAMPPPLNQNGVTYADGTAASIEQMAKDVTTFLAWSAEPEMEERKRTGIKVILFLLVLTGLLYATKRKVWAAVH
ncbi:MAG: cytochrome c1 [Alphaproteobacteria bacterium]